MKTMLKITLPVLLVLLAVGLMKWWPAAARPPDQTPLPGKAGAETKVNQDLIVLYDEYEAHRRTGSQEPFAPTNNLMRVVDDRVLIDAVATSDATELLADLVALGLQNGTAFGPKVSGQLPISAIRELVTLDSLKFVRPAYAATGGGVVTGQGGATTGSDAVRSADPVKNAEEKGNVVEPDKSDNQSPQKCDRP
jgi:hypothetical protein